MTSATLGANASAMPNRRIALGSIVAAGSMLAVPRFARAADLDTALLVLVGRVKAIFVERDAAKVAIVAAEQRMQFPAIPSALIGRPMDSPWFTHLAEVGKPLRPDAIDDVRHARESMLNYVALCESLNAEARPQCFEIIARADEIVHAAETHGRSSAEAPY